MADITMCKWENCTKKEKCYRYTAIVNEFRQSYFLETPKWDCDYFINNEKWKN